MANPNPNQKNLVKWKKGQSGNPKGRPPKLPHLQELIEKVLNQERDGITAIEAVVMALHKKAVSGDIQAIKELLDRYYGKAKNMDDSEKREETDKTIVILPAKDIIPQEDVDTAD